MGENPGPVLDFFIVFHIFRFRYLGGRFNQAKVYCSDSEKHDRLQGVRHTIWNVVCIQPSCELEAGANGQDCRPMVIHGTITGVG